MFRTGDKLGKYTLIRRLGSGAFGLVWLAESRTAVTTTEVALKIPLSSNVDLNEVVKEANLWVRASGHPNVLPIIEADIFDENLIIASEYASDGSLEEWLSKNGGKAPTPNKAVEIICGVLAGLEHLHKRGIIHRDLKPTNVLFQGEIPRLSDFGISRVLSSTTESRSTAGTPAFMAPEAFDGVRNQQTDIWSVGVMLYQLIEGSLPFPSNDIASLVKAILFDDPQTPRTFFPIILRSVIKQALCKDPNGRFRSAAEMREKLMSMPVQYELMMQPKPQPSTPPRTAPSPPYPCKSRYQYSVLSGKAELLDAEIELIRSAAKSWCSDNAASCRVEKNQDGFMVTLLHHSSDAGEFGLQLFLNLAQDTFQKLDDSITFKMVDNMCLSSVPRVPRAAKEPRSQHYFFAHRYLRDQAFLRPPQVLVNKLRSENGTRALYNRWMMNTKAKGAHDELIPPDGLESFPFEIGDVYRGAVVKLPLPAGMVEAFFTAFLLSRNGHDDWDDETAAFSCRFFTLELSMKESGSTFTILGEWVNDEHKSHGTGPVPDIDSFTDAISRVINKNEDADV